MPELPEVETVARDLAAQIDGRTITGVVHLDWPRMIETPDEAGFRAGIANRRILRVYRRAKWVLVALSGDLTLAVHLRMSGSLIVHAAEDPIDPHTHLDMPFGGTFSADDFESGTRAAAFGGTTSIVDFAIQSKGQSCLAGLETWHDIPKGRRLDRDERAYVVEVIGRWIDRELGRPAATG